MLTDINSLTRDELKSFSEFINSPYFNKSGAMKKLYCYLEGKHPEVTEEDVSKEKISRYIFNDLVASDVRMRKIESEFNKLFEKFLIHDDLEHYKTQSHIMLLPVLRKKFLNRSFKKKLDEIEKYSEEDFGFNDTYYLNKILYYHELKLYSDTELNKSPSGKELTWLNLYFVFQGLHFYLNQMGGEPQMISSMIKYIYEFIEKNKQYISKNHPGITVMYYACQITEPDGIIHLDKLESYYKKYKNNFTTELKTFYHQFVLNAMHLNRSINPTVENCTKFFKFLQRLLAEEYLKVYFEKGSMIQAQYFSCFNTIVNFQAFETAEKFAIGYNKYLSADSRNKMMNIAMLILNFFRKDFTDVMKRINEVSKDNIKLYVYSRYIKLMLLFELDDLQTLHYEIQSITKNLQRLNKANVIPEREIIRGKYFVNLITILAGAKEGRVGLNSKKFAELKSRLNSDEYMHEYRFWFLEKVKKMEKGLKTVVKNKCN